MKQATGTWFSFMLMALALWVPTAFAEESGSKGNASIVAVRASEAQAGNGPMNVLDTDPKTRWAAEGTGVWIAIEFAGLVELDRIDVGFYRGNRKYKVVLSTSVDGEAFERLGSLKSSGRGDGIESFAFKRTNVRYLRLTVNGSNENLWANIHTCLLYTSDAADE